MTKKKLVKNMIPIVALLLVLSVVSSAQTFSEQNKASYYSNQEDVSKTNRNNQIGFVEPGLIENVTDPTNGRTFEISTEIVWTPMVGSDTSDLTVDDFKEMVQSLKDSREKYKEVENDQNQEASRGLNIVFDTHGSWPSGALTALSEVEAYLEGLFYDPITVEIELYYEPMGGGVLGATGVFTVSPLSWINTRSRLQSGMDADDYIQDWLPSGSSIPVRYNGGSDVITNEYSCYFAKATYKAIGYSTSNSCADVTLNSNVNWDYDPSNGIPWGSYCFQSVAVHEIGHALGFISRAEEWYQDNNIFALDIFRFQTTDGSGDYDPDSESEFQVRPRLVDYNTPNNQHMSNIFYIDHSDIEYQMADGDPAQASHFRDGYVNGIMQPYFSDHETYWPNFYQTADLDMIDAIGWDHIFGGGESDPPEPDPMTWNTPPYPVSSSSISMVATTATDESPPIQYYFESPDGHSSSWQSSSTYTDVGLLPNTEYTYRVKARDGIGNEGNYSSDQSVYTFANTPDAPNVTNPTTSTLDVDVIPYENPDLLDEGFENNMMPPPGWTHINSQNPPYTWHIVDDSDADVGVHSGTYAAKVDRYIASAQDEKLITPEFDLTGYATITLEFWAASWTWHPSATVKVLIQYDETTDVVWDMIQDETWETVEYRKVTLDLSAYIGEVVTICFQYLGIQGWHFGLDDIIVSTLPAGAREGEETTEFAILCDSTSPYDSNWDGKYVDSTGGPRASAIWQTDDNWGITTVTGLELNSQYCFKVKARNDVGVETEFGPVACNITSSGGNQPPVVSDIPDQTINEGESFNTFDLDDYVDDPDNSDAEISWTWTGEIELTVDYNAVTHVVDILIPSPDWSGSEIITFRATDPGLLWDENAATFTVIAFYTLTININGSGTVTADPEGPSYPEETNVIMEAIPDATWRFIQWSGDLDTTENLTTITMDSDKSITAHFWRIGDTDGNGIVNVIDFLYLLSVWGSPDHYADFDGNGVVDVVDFLALLANWG